MRKLMIRALAAAFVALLVLGGGSAWAGHRLNNEVLIGGAKGREEPGRLRERQNFFGGVHGLWM